MMTSNGISDTYHAWRSRGGSRTAPTLPGTAPTEYADVPGFCKSASLEEVRKHGYVLTPGRYVGVEPVKDDGEPFQEKMARLSAQWRQQSKEARQLDEEIEKNLAGLGVLSRGNPCGCPVYGSCDVVCLWDDVVRDGSRTAPTDSWVCFATVS